MTASAKLPLILIAVALVLLPFLLVFSLALLLVALGLELLETLLHRSRPRPQVPRVVQYINHYHAPQHLHIEQTTAQHLHLGPTVYTQHLAQVSTHLPLPTVAQSAFRE